MAMIAKPSQVPQRQILPGTDDPSTHLPDVIGRTASTSLFQNRNGHWVILNTIPPGGGEPLPLQEALYRFLAEGQHMGIYDNREEALAAAHRLDQMSHSSRDAATIGNPEWQQRRQQYQNQHPQIGSDEMGRPITLQDEQRIGRGEGSTSPMPQGLNGPTPNSVKQPSKPKVVRK